MTDTASTDTASTETTSTETTSPGTTTTGTTGSGSVADCVFCKIIAGDVPARIVDEDEHAFSFLDVAPFHRGHTLVVPRRHVDSFIGESPALAEITPMIDRVARRLVDRLGADGINMFSSAGAVAGQEVFHLHVHLVPRYAATPGLRNLLGPKPRATDEDLESVWGQISAP